MKSRTILYWIVTSLAAAFMLLAGIPDLVRSADAVAIFNHLGYPSYLLPFLGTAKTLAAVVLVIPGVTRVKDWAFAGLLFDLCGALYSHVSVGDGPAQWTPAIIGLLLVGGAYAGYRYRAGESWLELRALSTTRSGW